MTYPVPLNEDARVAALRSLAVLDTAPEAGYDEVVGIARALFDAPMALVSLVDSNRQFFKARAGLDAVETGRDVSFCAHAIAEDAPLIILDAAADPRFCDNPFVTGPPFVRFYCGAPIILSSGLRMGSLCVIDQQPRPSVPQDKVQALIHLARSVTAQLEARKVDAAAKRAADDAARRAHRELAVFANHELRTPLNGIFGFLSLARQCTDAESDGHLDGLWHSAQNLLHLVERLTVADQMETGEVRLSNSVTPTESLLASVILAAEPVRRERGGQISLATDHAPPLLCDRVQLEMAMLNLVVNAIKHGGGYAEVTTSTAPDGGWTFSVRDRGPGLRAKAASALTGGDTCRLAEGLGLGLAVTRRIAKLHAGHLTVGNRADGVGCEAVLSLPAWRCLKHPAALSPCTAMGA